MYSERKNSPKELNETTSNNTNNLAKNAINNENNSNNGTNQVNIPKKNIDLIITLQSQQRAKQITL